MNHPQNKVKKYYVFKGFESKIYKDLYVPTGAIVEETIPTLVYFNHRPVAYIDDVLTRNIASQN